MRNTVIGCCLIGSFVLAGSLFASRLTSDGSDPRRAAAQDESPEEIRASILKLFQRNIDEGTSAIAPGVYAYTRVPLSELDLGKVVALGDKAVPILATLIDGPSVRFKELAIRSLGLLGDAKALAVLEATVLSRQSFTIRFQALQFAGSLTGEAARASLERMGRLSEDDRIRDRAKELLVQNSTR